MFKRTVWTLLPLLALVCVSVHTQETPQNDQAWVGWQTPTQRENGDPLAVEEIGGYELRYLEQTLLLPYPEATGYNVTELLGGEPLSGDYTVEISVYDTNGLYSTFVPVSVSVASAPPGPLLDARQLPTPDLVEKCLAVPTCRVGVISAMRSQ